MTKSSKHGTATYDRHIKTQSLPAGNSREIDSRALAQSARRLDEARGLMEKDAGQKNHREQLGEALRYNQRIWTIFQMALIDAENPLPPDLKALLLNLSLYIDKTSFQLSSHYESPKMESLITINRRIAAGLSKDPGENAAPLPPDTRDIPSSLTTSA